jgi:hypothetical protein
MFVLAHLGIGTWMARRSVRGEQLVWVLLGTLLPDLIDKPLYYALVFATGRHGAQLGLISSTRTVGHTLLLLLALLALLPRRIGAPLALGMATHLFLDELGDLAGLVLPFARTASSGPSVLTAILFPLLGWRFPVLPYASAVQHAASIVNVWTLACEVAGAALLAWQWRTGAFALGGGRDPERAVRSRT